MNDHLQAVPDAVPVIQGCRFNPGHAIQNQVKEVAAPVVPQHLAQHQGGKRRRRILIGQDLGYMSLGVHRVVGRHAAHRHFR